AVGSGDAARLSLGCGHMRRAPATVRDANRGACRRSTCTAVCVTAPVPASIIPARHHIIPDPLGPRTPNEGKAHDDRLRPERGTPFLAAPAFAGGPRRGPRR